MKRFFSYDENEGFVLHDTAESAKEAAQLELGIERDEAMKEGEWYDEVQTICWGELTENIVLVKKSKTAWDYELSPVVKNGGST